MPAPHRPLSRLALRAAVAFAVVLAGLPLAAPAHAAAGDRWSLAGQDPVTTAVALSRFAFPDGAPSALLARADAFPDALASGLLQDQGPLLLTAKAALDAATRGELARLGVEAVTVLGGTAAITEEVVQELRQAGYRVSRLSGPTRVATAVAVASSRPASRTVILARAFGGSGDASQGFADALAAGAWAAASGYPVLLSETAGLSADTAAYLRDAAVRTVVMVGGVAALSAEVEQQVLAMGIGVRRVSGAERAATAAAVAGAQGWDSSADVSQVVVVPGRGDSAWAAGFAAAALAAGGTTAVVLAESDALPVATRRFLRTGSADLVCTPLLARARCDEAAEELGAATPTLGAFGATDAADQEHGADHERSYAVTVDGGGPVTLALLDAGSAGAGVPGWALDADGDEGADLATGPVISGVGGRPVQGAAMVAGIRPSNGRVSFTVASAQVPAAVRPVAFVDVDGDGTLDVGGDGTPLEPASVGGATVWVPSDARAGSHAGQTLAQAWPALGLAATGDHTFRWDSGDTFAYNSGLAAPVSITKAEFEAMVSAGDTLAVNVGSTTSQLTIVRDVPAAPAGVTATPRDSDGDTLPDVVRVAWSRPANTDLAASGTYTVERSTRAPDGTWGAWSGAGEGKTPSTLLADIEAIDGQYRFRVLARNASEDVSAAGRPVLATVNAAAQDVPPAAVSAVFTTGPAQAATNKILDAGDSFTVTFTRPVRALAGAWVDLRDDDGTLMRLTRDVNAELSVGGDGVTLTVDVTGPPVKQATSQGDEELDVGKLVVVEGASGVVGDGGAWNLPGSGWAGAGEARTRTLVGATSGLPAAVPVAKISADAGLDRITVAAAATGIATGDPFTVYDVRGTALVSGTYHATNGTTVTSTAFSEGDRLLLVYTDLDGARLPSATASVLVGSPRPAVTKVDGVNDTITLVWSEAVTLIGSAALVEVFDKDDRLRVARTQTVKQAGTDRVLVDLDTDLATGTYTVHVAAGLVKDAGGTVNDALAPALTTSAAAPTLAVTTGPASSSTVTTAASTWTGTAADTVGVVTAVEWRVDGGAWSSTGVTAAVPDDSLTWSATLTLADGARTVEFRAVDDNGATSAVVSRTITVDGTAPTMTSAVAAIGARTITVTFSEPVTCPDTVGARAAWSFDDTSAGNSDGTGTAVTQTGLAANQCRITFSSPANFDAATTGTLTYGAPAAADDVEDAVGHVLAPNSTRAVTAA